MAVDNYTDLRYSFSSNDMTISELNDVELIHNDNSLQQNILFRLLIPRGEYLLNPNLGSDLHLLNKRKAVDITEIEVKDIITQALQPEIDAGNINNLSVKILEIVKDSAIIKLTVDVNNGNNINLNLKLN